MSHPTAVAGTIMDAMSAVPIRVPLRPAQSAAFHLDKEPSSVTRSALANREKGGQTPASELLL